jgi:hypothetical protein
MATISENISRINKAKTDIKNAIIAKGGSVADSDKIDTYATAIEALPSGGGGDETVKGIIDRSIVKCDIPQGTTSIGDGAFSGCTNLSSVTIPDSVTSIGSYAFNSCSKLTGITIPDSVTSIDYSAFQSCYALTSVVIGNGVTSIGNAAFSYCSKLTSVVIGNGVTSIGNTAFSYCYKLTNITIPDSVTSIGGAAFDGCSRLKAITVKTSTPPTLGLNVIPTNVTAIYVPSDSVDAYKSASGWSRYADKIQAIQE